MAELNNIKVSIQEKNEVKKDSPDTLPLNPTSQGFSGAEVRRRLSKSLTGEEGSVLSLLVDKMNIISDLFYIILDENDDESLIEKVKKIKEELITKLPKDGTEAMQGKLDMNGHDIERVNEVFAEDVYTKNLSTEEDDETIKMYASLDFRTRFLLKRLLSLGFENGTLLSDSNGIFTITTPNNQVKLSMAQLKQVLDGVDDYDTTNVRQLRNAVEGLEDYTDQELQALIDDVITPLKNRVVQLEDDSVFLKAQNLQRIQDLLDHNESEVAHLFIRMLIEALDKRVDAIEGRGNSWGVIPYLQSQLLAMTESARNTSIVNAVRERVSDYTPSAGHLVYTINDGVENAHEWEYNDTTWVDNGQWTVDIASNAEFGIVKGNDYVSIVGGLMQVLKSDYATRLGTQEAHFTYNTLSNILNYLTDDINFRYTKDETYSKTEIELKLERLKAIYGWKETLIIDNASSDIQVALGYLKSFTYIWILSKNGASRATELIETSKIEIGAKFSNVNVEITADGTEFSGESYTVYGISMDFSLIGEVRNVGDEFYVRSHDEFVEIIGEQVKTKILRNAYGDVYGIEESYTLDNKKYLTTFIKDSNGNVIGQNKKEII